MSIEARQKGITHNGLYWRRQRLELPMLKFVQHINIIPKLQFYLFCFAFANTLLYAVFFVFKNIYKNYFEKVCEIKIKYYLCQRLLIQLIFKKFKKWKI